MTHVATEKIHAAAEAARGGDLAVADVIVEAMGLERGEMVDLDYIFGSEADWRLGPIGFIGPRWAAFRTINPALYAAQHDLII